MYTKTTVLCLCLIVLSAACVPDKAPIEALDTLADVLGDTHGGDTDDPLEVMPTPSDVAETLSDAPLDTSSDSALETSPELLQDTSSCSTASDCDPLQPPLGACEEWGCVDGLCVVATSSDGTACQGESACFSTFECSAGACVGTTLLSCDDGSFCTIDECDETDGCLYTSRDCVDQSSACVTMVCDDEVDACVVDEYLTGTSCDDGNSCTTGDECDGGICVGAAKADGAACDDGSECTTDDVCSDGTCAGNAKAEGALCDDGVASTMSDQCLLGACSGTLTVADEQKTLVGVPRVASAGDGRFVVLWAYEEAGSITLMASLYDAAQSLVEAVTVSGLLDEAEGDVAMAWDGSFVVAYPMDTGSGQDILVQRFGPSGALVGTPILVNQDTALARGEPTVSMSADGSFIVAWTTEPGLEDNQINGRVFGPDGLPKTVDTKMSRGDFTGDDIVAKPDAAIHEDGSYVVVWQSCHDGTNGYGQDGDGCGIFGRLQPASGPLLEEDVGINGCINGDQTAPAVAVEPSGLGFVVSWLTSEDESCFGVQSHILTKAMSWQALNKSPVIPGAFNALYDPTKVDVAFDGGDSFVIVYAELGWTQADVTSFSVDYDGWADFEMLSIYTPMSPIGSLSGDDEPSLAYLGDDTFVVVWRQTNSGQDSIVTRVVSP